MSVLIKGMKMPCHGMVINIYPDGRVADHFDEFQETIATAVPVPPHGRLIDAAELQRDIHEHDYVLADEWNSKDKGMFTNGIDYTISVAPTIIPAEEGE